MKKIISFVLVFVLIASLSVTAFADVIDDPGAGNTVDVVGYNDTMDTNSGTVKENDGDIGENSGTVGENYGSIEKNSKDGVVNENYWSIQINEGTVKENYFEVNQNMGIVEENYGFVANVIDESTGTAGTVDMSKNYGTVDNTAIKDTEDPYAGAVWIGTLFFNTKGNGSGRKLEQLIEGEVYDLTELFSPRGYNLLGWRYFYGDDKPVALDGPEASLVMQDPDYYIAETNYTAEESYAIELIWERLFGLGGPTVTNPYRPEAADKGVKLVKIHEPLFKITDALLNMAKVSSDGVNLPEDAFSVKMDPETKDIDISFSDDFISTLAPGSHDISVALFGFTYEVSITV